MKEFRIDEEELMNALYRLNPNLPDSAISDALYKLKNYENGELVKDRPEAFINYQDALAAYQSLLTPQSP